MALKDKVLAVCLPVAAGLMLASSALAQTQPPAPSQPVMTPAPTKPAPHNHAKHHGKGEQGQAMMMDADHDGKVSWAEFTARLKTTFDKLDTNSDGYIDGTEMPKHKKKAGQGDGTWGKPDPSTPVTTPAPH